MPEQGEINFRSQEDGEEKAAWEAFKSRMDNMTEEKLTEEREKLAKSLEAARQAGEEYARASRAHACSVLRENEVFDSRRLIPS